MDQIVKKLDVKAHSNKPFLFKVVRSDHVDDKFLNVELKTCSLHIYPSDFLLFENDEKKGQRMMSYDDYRIYFRPKEIIIMKGCMVICTKEIEGYPLNIKFVGPYNLTRLIDTNY